MIELKKELTTVRERIAKALKDRREVKVTGSEICLVAVTKNHPPEAVQAAWDAGVWHIGENKVQEAGKKKSSLGEEKRCLWHLIGHLQTNKVKQAVELFDIIESVDSEKVAKAINQEALKLGKVQDILIQINIAREGQKSGFLLEEYQSVVPKLLAYDALRIRGIMVIAQQAEDAEDTRSVFAKGYSVFCDLQQQVGADQCNILSMGMTHDFWVAIEEGANSIRLGTALYGLRNYSHN